MTAGGFLVIPVSAEGWFSERVTRLLTQAGCLHDVNIGCIATQLTATLPRTGARRKSLEFHITGCNGHRLRPQRYDVFTACRCLRDNPFAQNPRRHNLEVTRQVPEIGCLHVVFEGHRLRDVPREQFRLPHF
jgi:hypothetical protein